MIFFSMALEHLFSILLWRKYLEAPIQQNIFADNLENGFCLYQFTEILPLINCNDVV